MSQLKQLIEEKKELEKKINTLVNEFVAKNEVPNLEIATTNHFTEEGGCYVYVSVKVNIKI